MTYKWNSADVETYAKAFSNLICNEYFKNQTSISGGDILKITEIKQLNLLIIRNLFEKWQEETSRLKSPYFDFEQGDVQTALREFMNTLSRFISIQRDKFESLLAQATKDTLQLAIEPQGYFENLMRNLPQFKLDKNWVEANKKYFQINKQVVDSLEIKLNGSTVYANQGIEWLADIFKSEGLEDSSEILEDFNAILPISFGNSGQSRSFFEEALDAAPAPRTLRPSLEKPELVTQVQPKKVEPIKQAVRTENEPRSLNDKLTNATQTLNDKGVAVKTKTLLDSHGKSKINSLRSGVSLNQRFLFINNLFAGNQEAYQKVMESLDGCISLSDAKNHVTHQISVQYQWDNNSAEAEEFYDLLERKFN